MRFKNFLGIGWSYLCTNHLVRTRTIAGILYHLYVFSVPVGTYCKTYAWQACQPSFSLEPSMTKAKGTPNDDQDSYDEGPSDGKQVMRRRTNCGADGARWITMTAWGLPLRIDIWLTKVFISCFLWHVWFSVNTVPWIDCYSSLRHVSYTTSVHYSKRFWF